MNKTIMTRKVANASLAFLISASHVSSAMDHGNDLSSISGPSAKLSDQIRAKVQKVLKGFQDNMNAYYQRTGNPKRITMGKPSSGMKDEQERSTLFSSSSSSESVEEPDDPYAIIGRSSFTLPPSVIEERGKTSSSSSEQDEEEKENKTAQPASPPQDPYVDEFPEYYSLKIPPSPSFGIDFGMEEENNKRTQQEWEEIYKDKKDDPFFQAFMKKQYYSYNSGKSYFNTSKKNFPSNSWTEVDIHMDNVSGDLLARWNKLPRVQQDKEEKKRRLEEEETQRKEEEARAEQERLRQAAEEKAQKATKAAEEKIRQAAEEKERKDQSILDQWEGKSGKNELKEKQKDFERLSKNNLPPYQKFRTYLTKKLQDNRYKSYEESSNDINIDGEYLYYFAPELSTDYATVKAYHSMHTDSPPADFVDRYTNMLAHIPEWDHVKKHGLDYTKKVYKGGEESMKIARTISLRFLEIPDEEIGKVTPELLEKWYRRLKVIHQDDPSKLQKIEASYIMLTKNDNEILEERNDNFEHIKEAKRKAANMTKMLNMTGP